MILPTTVNRSRTLDFARGFAVLGILLANLAYFGNSLFATNHIGGNFDRVELWTLVFVNGKFRSLLAIVFGVGLAMQYAKRTSAGDPWPAGYLKRTVYLGLFGLLHSLCIWNGDILYLYAWAAFFACWGMTWPRIVLKILVGIAIGIAVLGGIAGGVYGLLETSKGAESASSELTGIHGVDLLLAAANQWIPNFGMRGFIASFLTLVAPFAAIMFVPFFWLGMLLAENGVLKSPSQHPVTRNWMLAAGFGLGLPLNFIPVIKGQATSTFSLVAESASGPLLALGYLIAACIIAEKWQGARPVSILSRVGQASLSVYLLQSVVAVLLMQRPGVYGVSTPAQLLPYALITWVVVIVFANLWLKPFALGPAEWALRSLTEGKRLPIRRQPKPEPITVPPYGSP